MELSFFSAAEARMVRPLPTLLPRCDKCKLDLGCKTPKMRVDGAGGRKVLIVGDYPGADEDREGRPMAGATGKMLAEELANIGVDMRRDCWVTNAQICHDSAAHADGKSPKNSVAECRPNLLRTVAELDPEVIIPLGGYAITSVIGHLWKPDIGEGKIWTGQRIPAHKPNAWVCPNYNPAYLFRKNDDPLPAAYFKDHLKQAFKLRGRPWPAGPPDYASYVERIHDPAEASARLRAYTGGMAAFDFETTTLKADGPDAEIVCCSVCWNGTETIAFPWCRETAAELCRILRDGSVGKVGYNLKFEDRWIRKKLSTTVRGWAWDGMLAAHLIDPRRGVTGLKFQSFVLLGQPDYNYHIEPFLDSGREAGGNAPNRVREVKMDLLLKYCGMDSLLEYLVAERQMAEIGVSF